MKLGFKKDLAIHLTTLYIYKHSNYLPADASKSRKSHIYTPNFFKIPIGLLKEMNQKLRSYDPIAAVQGRASVTSSICSLVSQSDSRSIPLLPFTIAIDLISSIGQYYHLRGQVCSLCSCTDPGT